MAERGVAFAPTDEQEDARRLFAKGDSLVIEAGAGCGKTSVLSLIAHDADARHLHGRFLAFNRSIVADVSGKLPESCVASTAHSLAFRTVGKPYAHRLRTPRMSSWLLAQYLNIDPFVIRYGEQSKVLQPGYLASLAMRAISNFCHSADERPSLRHVPYVDGIDVPRPDGARSYDNNRAVARWIEPALGIAWLDIMNPQGQLPYKHDFYLKSWQLSHPRTAVDYLLIDESQDLDPVMAAVVAEQEHAQRVWVGDENQEIYGWRGTRNAVAEMKQFGFPTSTLTMSFRFGDPIADVANVLLDQIGSELRLRGLPSLTSTVGPLDDIEDADAILCRTNAATMERLLAAKQRGARAHLVGGGTELAAFTRGAKALKAGETTGHPDLACFDSWGAVQDYVASDPSGSDLALLVKLVDDFGVATILTALERMPKEADADLVISTAHKGKGREWPVVMLDGDFATTNSRQEHDDEDDPHVAELRLRYVAVTRARVHLDDSALHPTQRPEDTPSATL